MVTLYKTDVPATLRHLAKPPEKLHITGDLQALMDRPRLAVVGSRKASPYGKAVTTKLVSELAQAGVVIISGLAYGIDSIAHTACLDAGGQTVAVLPSDLYDIYPGNHASLAARITGQGGALVSEYDRGTVPYPSNFLERNRLIAGLSDAVLITEAAQRSGSFNTANHALEQGKTVLAVPGNITSSLSEGCNNLIKAGAVPVTTADDIFDVMGWQRAGDQTDLFAANREEHAILELIGQGISDGGQLQAQSGLDVPLFNQTLTMLEITGRIRALGANQWAIT